MLTVQSLAGWEAAVLASVRGATGTLEERDRQVERSGMYGEYPAILSAYLEIVDPSAPREHERAEALKRAVFIAWYAGVAPRCLTGIGDLGDVAVADAFAKLEGAVRRGEADAELLAMVAHYGERFAAPFELYGAAGALARAAAADQRVLRVAPSAYAARGQMGDYFAALVTR